MPEQDGAYFLAMEFVGGDDMLRNALDHGLETPQERQSNGKTRGGHLKLAARQQGAEIILSLEDDGRGIDPDRIKERAQPASGLFVHQDRRCILGSSRTKGYREYAGLAWTAHVVRPI